MTIVRVLAPREEGESSTGLESTKDVTVPDKGARRVNVSGVPQLAVVALVAVAKSPGGETVIVLPFSLTSRIVVVAACAAETAPSVRIKPAPSAATTEVFIQSP
jgi:hypothetical protein